MHPLFLTASLSRSLVSFQPRIVPRDLLHCLQLPGRHSPILTSHPRLVLLPSLTAPLLKQLGFPSHLSHAQDISKEKCCPLVAFFIDQLHAGIRLDADVTTESKTDIYPIYMSVETGGEDSY